MYLGFGLDERLDMLVDLEKSNASGAEEKIFAHPNKVSGKRTLKSFVEANKDAWKA